MGFQKSAAMPAKVTQKNTKVDPLLHPLSTKKYSKIETKSQQQVRQQHTTSLNVLGLSRFAVEFKEKNGEGSLKRVSNLKLFAAGITVMKFELFFVAFQV
jgi:hypothetical protein